MIESCSRKRMVLAISCLVGLSVVVLIIENEWTPGDTRRHTHGENELSNLTSRDLCWKQEEYTELEECKPCSDFEVKSKTPAVCSTPGHRQKLKCKNSGEVYRRCDRIEGLEERHFWAFETTMGAIGLVAGAATFFRQRTLDHRILQRIQRQVAAGV
ncbi:protein JTB-like [Oratosquilla oratoria]|uniref:protein JTB-like n=1 Tax=Oratosquilla oratoria TaxID=337810 RepID=UPI003F76A46A